MCDRRTGVSGSQWPKPATINGLGRRIVVKLYDDQGVLDSTTRFIYNGGSVIEEHIDDSGWVFDAAYIHGLGIDNVLAVTHNASGTPSSYHYYHYDGIGSVTELTDADGALAQAYEYDAWGIATIYDPGETAIRNSYLFTGRRWDAAIALYYYRARHYDPALGRFLQTDPAGYDAGINLYLYVGSTPTMFIDPAGLQGVYRWNGEEYVDVASDPGGIITDPYGNTTQGHINTPRRMGEFREPVNTGSLDGELGAALENVGKAAVGVFDSLVVAPINYLRTRVSVTQYRTEHTRFGPMMVPTHVRPSGPITTPGEALGIENSASYVRGEAVGRRVGAAGEMFAGVTTSVTPLGWGLMADASGEVLATDQQFLTGRRVPNPVQETIYKGLTKGLGLEVDRDSYNEVYTDLRVAGTTIAAATPRSSPQSSSIGRPVAVNRSRAPRAPGANFPDGPAVTNSSPSITARVPAGALEEITAPTRGGQYPSWRTVGRRYWKLKTRGEVPRRLARVRVRATGEIEVRQVAKEFHHIEGRGGSNPHRFGNLKEYWPWEHEALDPSRHTGYDFIEWADGD